MIGGQKRNVASLFFKKGEFLLGIDELFDVFCDNSTQGRRLEKEHKLRIADEDYSFYNDQKGLRTVKCLAVPLPLTSSDKQFIRLLQIKPNFASSSAYPSEIETESAADNVSESESIESQTRPRHQLLPSL